MRTIHQGPGAPSPDLQAEYTQAIRPRYLPFFENALAFGGSPYTRLGVACTRYVDDVSAKKNICAEGIAPRKLRTQLWDQFCTDRLSPYQDNEFETALWQKRGSLKRCSGQPIFRWPKLTWQQAPQTLASGDMYLYRRVDCGSH